MAPATVLPDPTQVELVTLSATATGITAIVQARASSTPCPVCGCLAQRVHSRYVRHVADLPWHEVPFRLHLHVRRFFCDQAECPRVIFTERLSRVVAPYARRTMRLAQLVELVGFLLGGAAGSRLLRHLALGRQGNSRDTVVRAIRRAALPTLRTPRVLSVDDFSFRRGRTFGTILVDLERHRVVDVLPEARAETFAAWLCEHPGAQIISRDRGGAYADGAHQGAPQAVQVADRFHLLRNVLDAFDRVLLRHHTLLAFVSREVAKQMPVPMEPAPAAPPTPTRAERDALVRQERRQARHEAVVRAHAAGTSVREVARTLGLARNTVRRYLQVSSLPQSSRRPPRVTKLTRFEPYLRTRWDAGEQNSAALLREVHALGYTGSASVLRHFLSGWRIDPRRSGRRPTILTGQPAPPRTRTFSPRYTRWLLVDAVAQPDTHALAYRDALLERSPVLRHAQDLVAAFLTLVRARDVQAFPAWLAQAEMSGIPELAGVAGGMRRDSAAIEAALLLEHSQGQTEGQVNRLKLLKRQMYGRAKFDLLRQRVLYQAGN